jgi:hypothetical protein
VLIKATPVQFRLKMINNSGEIAYQCFGFGQPLVPVHALFAWVNPLIRIGQCPHALFLLLVMIGSSPVYMDSGTFFRHISSLSMPSRGRLLIHRPSNQRTGLWIQVTVLSDRCDGAALLDRLAVCAFLVSTSHAHMQHPLNSTAIVMRSNTFFFLIQIYMGLSRWFVNTVLWIQLLFVSCFELTSCGTDLIRNAAAFYFWYWYMMFLTCKV